VRTDGQLVVHHVRPGSNGLPLVLLHGFPLDRRMWDDVIDLVPGSRPILVVELPGFGDSPRGQDVAEALGLDPEPSLEVSAAGVVAAVRAAGFERAAVVGLSMGGYVAMAVLEAEPRFVAALGLIDTKASADTPEARANRLRIAEEVERTERLDEVLGMRTALLGETSRAARPDLVERLESWIGDQGPGAVAWAQRAMAARPDRTEVLRGYAGPSLVVVGAEDEVTPLQEAEAMVAALSERGDSELVVVSRAGHMTTIERPETVASVLSSFWLRAGHTVF